jgi:radical SAM superfamily enzyme
MKMRMAGCWGLAFGLESGSEKMLRLINKESTVLEAEKASKDAADLGIAIFPLFISGYPHESEQDIADTIDFIRRNRNNFQLAKVHLLDLQHGSSFWKDPGRYGITNLIPKKYQNHSFGFDEIGGLPWPEKQAQQQRTRQKILKAVKKYQFLKFIREKYF